MAPNQAIIAFLLEMNYLFWDEHGNCLIHVDDLRLPSSPQTDYAPLALARKLKWLQTHCAITRGLVDLAIQFSSSACLNGLKRCICCSELRQQFQLHQTIA